MNVLYFERTTVAFLSGFFNARPFPTHIAIGRDYFLDGRRIVFCADIVSVNKNGEPSVHIIAFSSWK
jgi:hypothetical protein